MTWICKNCMTENDDNSISCNNCMNYYNSEKEVVSENFEVRTVKVIESYTSETNYDIFYETILFFASSVINTILISMFCSICPSIILLIVLFICLSKSQIIEVVIFLTFIILLSFVWNFIVLHILSKKNMAMFTLSPIVIGIVLSTFYSKLVTEYISIYILELIHTVIS